MLLVKQICNSKTTSNIQIYLSTCSSESRSIEDILKAWTQEKLFSNDFEYIEPIYNIRVSVLQVLHNQTDSVQTCIQRELLELSRLAVQNNRYLVCSQDNKGPALQVLYTGHSVSLSVFLSYFICPEHNSISFGQVWLKLHLYNVNGQ